MDDSKISNIRKSVRKIKDSTGKMIKDTGDKIAKGTEDIGNKIVDGTKDVIDVAKETKIKETIAVLSTLLLL